MKKQLNLRIIAGVLLTAYIVIFTSFYYVSSNSFVVKNWFTVALLFVGIYLLIKSWFFRSDSSLYLGSLILALSCFNLLLRYFNLDLSNYWNFYVLIFAISSLLLFVVFKSKFHLKLGFILLLFFVIFSLYVANFISLIVLLLLCALNVLLGLFLLLKKGGENEEV